MKVLTLILLTLAWLIPARAQQKGATASQDGFPQLPTFDVEDTTAKQSRADIEEQIKYLGLTTRTPVPLKVEELSSSFPWLGPAAFEVLSTKPIQGTFAMASPEEIGSEMGLKRVINLSLTRFDNSLEYRQMFYRRVDTVGIFHSPQFSPNGKTIFFRDGVPVQDRGDGYNGMFWNLDKGRLRFEYLILSFPHLFWSPGSRFLSVIEGGDAFTDDNADNPQQLVTFDTKTRHLAVLMDNPGLCWSWTYDVHLLCAHIPRGKPVAENARPSVYRVAVPKGGLIGTPEARKQTGTPVKLFDGGYYAHQAPDGKNIVFCDWAGPLLEDQNASDELKNNAQQGLWVWNVATKTRAFLGEMAVRSMQPPRAAPQMVWSSDSRRVFVLTPGRLGQRVVGRVYVADVVAKTCKVLGQVAFTPAKNLGWFEPRLQLSPDEKRLYLDARENIDGPQGRMSQRYTLWQMNTTNGQIMPLARLTNIEGENPDWDFYDDSGINPAFAAAQKIEEALPAIKENQAESRQQ